MTTCPPATSECTPLAEITGNDGGETPEVLGDDDGDGLLLGLVEGDVDGDGELLGEVD